MVNGPLKELLGANNFLNAANQNGFLADKAWQFVDEKLHFHKEYKDKTYLFVSSLYHFLRSIQRSKLN